MVKKDLCVTIENVNANYRVYAGDYKDYNTAVNVKRDLEKLGIECYIVKKKEE